MKTEPAIGWGLRVGGPRPYISWQGFGADLATPRNICTEKYHSPMRCALIPLAEYRRLRRAAKSNPPSASREEGGSKS